MNDPILRLFLERQFQEGLELDRASDLLDLLPASASTPDRYVATFHCKGLVREAGGTVAEANRFRVGIWFPSDYLRRAEPTQILTWLEPRRVFHPNISDVVPFICIGRLSPGTRLVDILYQVFEIITYRKVTMREDDALNGAACAWARRNQDLFPIDRRPLKRRTLRLQVEAT
jgi:hypothetical protein